MEGLLLILCTFCFCFPPGKMQPEALCAPSSFTVAWPLCKNCSFCMKCSVLIWMGCSFARFSSRVAFWMRCLWVPQLSYKSRNWAGKKKKSELETLCTGDQKKKKGTNQGEETFFFQWVCNRMVENRGLLVCASRTKWRMGVAWSEPHFFFYFFFMFSAAGKEGIKWWERGSFRNWRKGDLGQGRHEVTGSLPSRLCCICSMPKTYGFSCFVL